MVATLGGVWGFLGGIALSTAGIAGAWWTEHHWHHR